MGVITFNGVTSTSVNVQVEHQPNYEIAERDLEFIHVPGRNGDFVIDNGGWKNTRQAYDISFIDWDQDFFYGAHKVSKWLNSAPGYARLEDTYDSLYYRMALYNRSLNITDILGKAGRCTIEFECKPQRFLKSGDNAVTFTTRQSTIENPLDQPSKPIIKVYGTGSTVLSVGNGYQVTIPDIGGLAIVDSEVMDIYRSGATISGASVGSAGFPILNPGSNGIEWSSGSSVTKIEVIPRWWTL